MAASLSGGGDRDVRPEDQHAAVRGTAARASEAVHALVQARRQRDAAVDLILRWDLSREEMNVAARRGGLPPPTDEEWAQIERDCRALAPGHGAVTGNR